MGLPESADAIIIMSEEEEVVKVMGVVEELLGDIMSLVALRKLSLEAMSFFVAAAAPLALAVFAALGALGAFGALGALGVFADFLLALFSALGLGLGFPKAEPAAKAVMENLGVWSKSEPDAVGAETALLPALGAAQGLGRRGLNEGLMGTYFGLCTEGPTTWVVALPASLAVVAFESSEGRLPEVAPAVDPRDAGEGIMSVEEAAALLGNTSVIWR